MNRIRVDDMLIEIISPTIKEIEEKFNIGKGLNKEDMNALLLKSRYNHINHLNDKPNKTTASVVALNKSMFMLMAMMGFFLTLLKVLDMFIK